MGSFEASVMGLLQSECSPSAGAADTQLHTTTSVGHICCTKLVFASAACLLTYL